MLKNCSGHFHREKVDFDVAIFSDFYSALDRGNRYGYDCNGNMTTRVIGGTTYTLTYDYENRLTGVSGGGITASFVYDGDGKRVRGTAGGVTTTYIGNYLSIFGRKCATSFRQHCARTFRP